MIHWFQPSVGVSTVVSLAGPNQTQYPTPVKHNVHPTVGNKSLVRRTTKFILFLRTTILLILSTLKIVKY